MANTSVVFSEITLISVMLSLIMLVSVMRKQKIEWKSIGIPKALFERLRKLITRTGHVSVSEYIREAVAIREQWHVEQLERAFEE